MSGQDSGAAPALAPGAGPEARWPHVAAFLVLAFGWSWGFWVPRALAAAGLLGDLPSYPRLGAFGPTVAALALVAYDRGLVGARDLLARALRLDFPKRWLLPALLLSPALVGVSLAVAVATGTTPQFPWSGQPVVLVVAFAYVLLLGGPLQEEFGWRGYLHEHLRRRLAPAWTGLVVGLVWAAWHLPLFYVPSETIYYRQPFLGFAVSITLLSVLVGWVYENSRLSLLPAILFHASFNWSQGMFPILDSDPASLTLVGTLVATTVAVVVYWGTDLVRDGDG